MPAVVVDTSVLISLAAAEQFHLLRDFYTIIHVPPQVWHELQAYGTGGYGWTEAQTARQAGWLRVQSPATTARVIALPFRLQAGETEALALALELPDALLLADDAPARRAASALGLAYTGTLGVLLRARAEGRFLTLHAILQLLTQRTRFRLSTQVWEAALRQAGETP